VEPIYVASATLAAVPVDESGGALAGLGSQVGGLAALAGISVGDGTLAKDEAIAILKSKALTFAFLRDNDLLPVLFKDKWNAKTKQWAVDAERVPTISDAWEVFDAQIRFVREDRRTGLITLSVEWSDREAAANWVTELISRLNNLMRARDVDEAERSILYLNRELDKAQSVEVRQTIYRVMETQIKKIMLSNVRAEYAMRVIDPPVIPDVDEFVSPRLFPSVAAGGLAGTFCGAIFAFWMASRARRKGIGNLSVQKSESGGATETL
jgi:hypothetical protein